MTFNITKKSSCKPYRGKELHFEKPDRKYRYNKGCVSFHKNMKKSLHFNAKPWDVSKKTRPVP
tara:strand:+ start:196 stop:384 length:189 start_codon:yes stop_codon:yes gene_type:complete